MTRPTTPPIERLSKQTNRDLSSILNSWPVENPARYSCIIGPRQIWHDGRPQPTVRLLFEQIMPQTAKPWRIKNLCTNSRCINPLHHTIKG